MADNASLARVLVAKRLYQAYVDDDRGTLETLLADDLCFFSPWDNGIGRETYLALCWPNHERIAAFEFVRVQAHGDEVFVTYVQRRHDGGASRNTEILTVRDGRIVAVEVYFGWSLPHPAAPGTHRGPES